MSKTIELTALAGGALGLAFFAVTEFTDIFLPKNIVDLDFTINEDNTATFIREFERAVQNYNGEDPVIVRINSRGGFVMEGEQIIAAIENAGVPVILRCENLAASMAAEILITTENVQRDAAEDCRIHIHTPRLTYVDESGVEITETLDDLYLNSSIYHQMFLEAEDGSLRQQAIALLYFETRENIEFLMDESVLLIRELAAATNLAEEDFAKIFIEDDVDFYATEALLYGFIDTIEGQAATPETSQIHLQSYCLSWDNQFSICQQDEETTPVAVPEF